MGKDLLFGILIGIFLSVIGSIAYNGIKNLKSSVDSEMTIDHSVPTIIDYSEEYTIDDRIAEWLFEKEVRQYEDTFYELPEGTLRLILEKIGVDASLVSIVKEYLNNRTYYFTKSAMREVDNIIENQQAPQKVSPDDSITTKLNN